MSIKTSKLIIGILCTAGLAGTANAQLLDDKFTPRVYGSLAVTPAYISKDVASTSNLTPSRNVVVTPVSTTGQTQIISASSTTGSYTADVEAEARRVIAFQNATSAPQHVTSERQYAIELFEPAQTTTVSTLPSQRFVEQTAVAATSHHVIEGDTLFNIAKRYNTDVAALKRSNNIAGNGIQVGQNLAIPSTSRHIVASNVTTTQTAQTTQAPRTESRLIRTVQPVPSRGVYAVLPKDTLWSIASRACVTVEGLRAQNGLGDSDYIAPGQRLTMPLGHCLN